jgi:pimeloyl-ACP methyl ester carboxylesterase
MITFAWSALILAAVIYGAFCLVLFLTQAKLIFYPDIPSRQLAASPADIGLAYESVTLTTSDDVRIHGWFVPAPGAKGTLLFFHGNAGNISHRLDSLQIFHDLGLSCLIIDYRGYGRSEGAVSEQGTYLDAEAAWNYLAETRKIPAREIIVFGRSLGAAIAAYTASRHRPGALILESAFTSVPDMGATARSLLSTAAMTGQFPMRTGGCFTMATGAASASWKFRVITTAAFSLAAAPTRRGSMILSLPPWQLRKRRAAKQHGAGAGLFLLFPGNRQKENKNKKGAGDRRKPVEYADESSTRVK